MKRSIRFTLELRKKYLESLEENLQQNDFELEVRMWYLDKVSLTPFDERYLKVPFEWMEFSYLKFMETDSPEDRRNWYLSKKAEKKANEKYEQDLEAHIPKTMFIDEGQRKDIMQAFRDTK